MRGESWDPATAGFRNEPIGATALHPVAPTSIVDRVSRELRQAVLAGHLRPGQTFSIAQLCSELGVSHIPVREALRRLEVQGLVELRPGRSGIVTPINIDDLNEIYALRAMVETGLIREAAPRYTDDDIESLQDNLETMTREAHDPQGDAFWASHNRFHWCLLEPAAGAWSARVLGPLWHAAERYLRLFLIDHEDVGASMVDHSELLDAAKRRSADDLGTVLQNHLQQNREQLARCIHDLEDRYTD